MGSSESDKVFTYEHLVTLGDTSAEADVYYNNFGRIFGEVREYFLRSFFSDVEKPFQYLREELNVTIMTGKEFNDFKKPAFHEDVLLITVCLSELDRIRAVMSYEFFKKETDELLCKGFQEVFFFNLKTMKPTRIPKIVLDRVEGCLAN